MGNGEFKMLNSKLNDPLAEQQSIESVIAACPESFCIEEGFPASGNDNVTKNELLRPEAEL
jgi:hypothetical protein